MAKEVVERSAKTLWSAAIAAERRLVQGSACQVNSRFDPMSRNVYALERLASTTSSEPIGRLAAPTDHNRRPTTASPTGGASPGQHAALHDLRAYRDLGGAVNRGVWHGGGWSGGEEKNGDHAAFS